MADGFYIHYADPGFPEMPWPGVRRLGPFNTYEEAEAQAVENEAIGFGAPVGIYSDLDSANMQNFPLDTTEDVPASAGDLTMIAEKANTRRTEILEASAQAVAESRAQIQSALPEGVDLDEFLKGVTQ